MLEIRSKTYTNYKVLRLQTAILRAALTEGFSQIFFPFANCLLKGSKK